MDDAASPSGRGLSRAFVIWDAMRARAPRVHCLTNAVAQAFTANMLLAAGATPSMTIAPDEVAAFAARADALLINLGTLDPERRAAIPRALDAAMERGTPFALDPTFCDVSAARADFARALLARRPAVLRLNAGEFAALSGREATREACAALARETGAVVALTGEVDLVTDGVRSARLADGHPLMAKVTAVGCAAGALIAACLAVGNDPFEAALAGLGAIGVAGALAGVAAAGPGSFAPALIDAIHRLDAETLAAKAHLTLEAAP